MQSTGGWDIPDAPPPRKKYCMSYKDFSVLQEMRDRSLLFCSVIGDSRLNATCSFACVQKSPISFVARGKGKKGNRRQLVRQNLLKTRHWWVAQINLLKKMYLVEDSCLFLLNLKKKIINLKYLATLPLAIASPSPAQISSPLVVALG